MKNLFTLFVAILCAAAIHAANYSGTLPVLHINTENSTPITSKEYYLNGTYYLDNLGIEGYKSIGSANEPLTLKIKGRGNYTFTGFDKKPYRLKLDAKAALLGMKKSKHFALLAHADDNLGFLRNTMGFELSRRGGLDFTPEQRPVEVVLNGEYIGLYFLTETIRVDSDRVKKSKHFALLAHADDNLGFLRNTMGFELSRRGGLDFTPEQRPVEVVLNGEYIGLYFLTETIRVDSDRVKITEQADNISDPEEITGGWLVEIDNYLDADQVTINEGNGELIRLTYKSPEVLSVAQSDYLKNLATAADRAIYASDKSSTEWENIVDIDSLATFYLIQEIMDNAESFHGSCYFHKHRGADTKIIFGPVWDFGNSYHRSTDKFIHQDPPYGQTWIAEIAKFPRFQARVKQLWDKFLDNDYASLDKFASDFAKQIAKAAECDANRWPNYGNRNMENAKNEFMKMLHAKVSWLKKQWGESGITGTEENALNVTVADGGQLLFSGNVDSATAFDLSGRPANIELTSPTTARIDGMAGIYIVRLQTASSAKTVKVVIPQ